MNLYNHSLSTKSKVTVQMAPKTAKLPQKPAKSESTLDTSQQANSDANEDATGASKATSPDQILAAIQAMKEDFVSRFDGLLNAIQGVQGELKTVTMRVMEAEDGISTNQDGITSLLAQNTTIRKAIDELLLKVDDLENHSRRSNLVWWAYQKGRKGLMCVCFWRNGYLMCLVQLTFLGHR